VAIKLGLPVWKVVFKMGQRNITKVGVVARHQKTARDWQLSGCCIMLNPVIIF